MLVAVVMLFVVGAMAALSIDVVTLYTARSEAQLAADAAALAAARVLANSGMTSDLSGTVMPLAQPLASTVATQVATQNSVGGRNLAAGEVTVDFLGTITHPCSVVANPCVTVRVQRADLPTFFARIWGKTTLTVGASATAEAYNPSALASGITSGTQPPVAPSCVKPWLLPNMDPTNSDGVIFDPSTGAINAGSALMGWPTAPGHRFRTNCTTCDTGSLPVTSWRYYPLNNDGVSYPAPSAASVVCPGCTGFNAYQLSIAGCVQTPVSCTQTVNIDQNADAARDFETRDAVNGLTHANANEGDSVDLANPPSPPFQFLAGNDNPVVASGAVPAGGNIMVSDSIVTVPVVNIDTSTPNPIPGFPAVQIIGFVQLFLNSTGQTAPFNGRIHTTVINLVGCGTAGTTGRPILGNGASAVPVRLISPGP
jgi:hypothetical protein